MIFEAKVISDTAYPSQIACNRHLYTSRFIYIYRVKTYKSHLYIPPCGQIGPPRSATIKIYFQMWWPQICRLFPTHALTSLVGARKCPSSRQRPVGDLRTFLTGTRPYCAEKPREGGQTEVGRKYSQKASKSRNSPPSIYVS